MIGEGRESGIEREGARREIGKAMKLSGGISGKGGRGPWECDGKEG